MKSASELLGDHREGRGAVQYGGWNGGDRESFAFGQRPNEGEIKNAGTLPPFVLLVSSLFIITFIAAPPVDMTVSVSQ